MDRVEAQKLFPSLGNSFTGRELKKLFRQQSFIMHPDSGGNAADFDALKKAYDVLKSFAVSQNGEGDLMTVDGIPLAELGGGLPLTVSARECSDCEGRGWGSFSETNKTETCPECDGEGVFWLPCRKCNGTGDYKHPRSGKVVGACNLCGGTGHFYPVYKSRVRGFNRWIRDDRWIVLPDGRRHRVNVCKRCSGEGVVYVPDEGSLLYTKCGRCGGVGEEQIYNPVLPRGLFVG